MSFKNRYTKIAAIFSLVFVLMMALRLFFYFKYQDYFQNLTSTELILSLLYGLRVDIITIFTFLGVFILALALPFKFVFNKGFERFLVICFVLTFVPILAFCLGDILYFEFSQRHISNELLNILDDINILVQMGIGSMKIYLIFFVLSTLLLSVIFYKLFLARVEVMDSNYKHYLYLLLIVMVLFLGIRGTVSGKSFGVTDAYSTNKISSGALALNGFFTFYRTIIGHQGNEKKQLMEYEDALILAKKLLTTQNMRFISSEYPIQRELKEPKKRQYNVLITMFESWGAEHIDGFTKYGELDVTPNFKKIANEGVRFVNFYANGARSIYGITSLYTSVTLPSGFQYLGHGLELTNLSYLGQIAKKNGYKTLAMQSSQRRSYRVDAISKLAGFDEYYGAEDMPNVESVEGNREPNTGTYDYNMFDFMHKKLNNFSEPFLSFMFTSTNHSDFHLPHSKYERYPHTLAGYHGYLN